MQDGGRRHLGFGHYFTFDVNVELCTAQSILMSSVVKIGAMVPKLQCFSKFKMAVAAILNFATTSNMTNPAR